MKDSDSNVEPSLGAGNILRQLHESDSRGIERKREVVRRPDGSKVIRVEKRRRTYSDEQQEAKKAGLKNKRFLIGLCILILLVAGGLVGMYMYRLTSFNTEEFSTRMKAELSAAWGGNVEISGMTMDGRSLKASRITVTFPEDSCLSFVIMEGVSGEISATSLFMGKVKGESLNMGRAVMGLRPGYAKFALPQTGRELPFSFQRYTAPRLEVGYADEREPFTLDRNGGAFYLTAEAYIRTSLNGVSREYVLDLSQQRLKIKGWPLFAMDTGSVIVDGAGIKQLTFSGFVDKGALFNKPMDLSPFMITGSMRLGNDFRHRHWNLAGRNFELAQLAGDSFASILKVRMGEQPVEDKYELNMAFSLPVDKEQKRPSLQGTSGSVIKATLMNLPVCRLLTAMTARRTDIALPYSSPVFTSGSFILESDGTDQAVSLRDISLFEQSFLGVTGNLHRNGSKVSGELVFKLPSYMASTPQVPAGVRQEGHELVITVGISGTPASPTDNSGGMLQELKSLPSPRPSSLPPSYSPAGTGSSIPAVPSPGPVTVDGFM